MKQRISVKSGQLSGLVKPRGGLTIVGAASDEFRWWRSRRRKRVGAKVRAVRPMVGFVWSTAGDFTWGNERSKVREMSKRRSLKEDKARLMNDEYKALVAAEGVRSCGNMSLISRNTESRS